MYSIVLFYLKPGIGYLEENFRPVASPVYNQVHMDFYMKGIHINIDMYIQTCYYHF